jgi:cell wall-associated NlpC family hydrolase
MSERNSEDTRRPYNYEVTEDWKEWVGRPWPESHKDRGLGGCYQIVRDFYKTYYGRDLYDYPSQRKYLFKSEYIEEEQRRQGGFETIYQGGIYDETPLDNLEVGDVMIMRLFYDRLQGGYSWKEGRTCNHCGIYLGDGFMLHHPAWETSRIADLVALQYWADNTEVVLRLKDRKLLKPYIKTKGEIL